MLFGFQGGLYYLTSGTRATWTATPTNGIYSAAAPTGLALLTGVQDVKTGLNFDKANASSRDGQGAKYTEPSLLDFTMTFKLIWNQITDASQLALLTAAFQRKVFPLAALDQPKATSGAFGFWVDYKCTKFEKDETLAEVQAFDVEMSPCVSLIPPQIVQVP